MSNVVIVKQKKHFVNWYKAERQYIDLLTMKIQMLPWQLTEISLSY